MRFSPIPFVLLLPCIPLAAQARPAAREQAEIEALLHQLVVKGQAVAKARAAHLEAGKNSFEFKGDVDRELAEVAARLNAETRPRVRQALLVARIGYLRLGRRKPSLDQLDRVLREVPATSRDWEVEPGLLRTLGGWAPRETAAYLAEARAHHPDGPTRRALLFDYFTEMIDTGSTPDWKPTFDTLQKDFSDSHEALMARERVTAELSTAVGAPAPVFSLPSLEDPKVLITLDTFKGKFVLLDFWATWCPDCHAAMPELHRAQAAFKGKGLEVLSLSFDRRVEHIAPYRGNPATPMPWHHVFVPQGFKNPVSEAYGVRSIPKLVLVGPDGRIVATGGELRGENLERTLARFLDGGQGAR